MSKQLQLKKHKHQRRKMRVRKKITGTIDIPRISIFRSNKYLYVQAINDVTGHTLASSSSKVDLAGGNTVDVATQLGVIFAERLKNCNIKKIVFDRNGYLYHGVVKALADSVRSQGIVF